MLHFHTDSGGKPVILERGTGAPDDPYLRAERLLTHDEQIDD